MLKNPYTALLALGLTVPAGAALAHHGWAWTTGDNVELIGVIEEARLGNPHGLLDVGVDGETWTVEVGQPWRNERAGLKDGDLAPGVEIRAIGEPAADPADEAAQGRAAVPRRARVSSSIPSATEPLEALLAGLEATAVAQTLRGARWLYAADNTAHLFGIALLVGAILPLDLRLLGCWPGVPRAQLARVLVPVAAIGLAIAVLAGAPAVLGPGARVCRRRLPAGEAGAGRPRRARGPGAALRHGFLLETAGGPASPRTPFCPSLLARSPGLRPADRIRRGLIGLGQGTSSGEPIIPEMLRKFPYRAAGSPQPAADRWSRAIPCTGFRCAAHWLACPGRLVNQIVRARIAA